MRFLIVLLIVVITPLSSYSQEAAFPKVTLESLGSGKIDSDKILNKEGPTVISFWATWCKPCIVELNELNDVYEDWQSETNVKIIAISIDDSRTSAKVPAFVNGRGWEFDIYLDENSDLKRALNIANVPYSMLLNQSGKIEWQHAGYVPGDEEVILQKLQELTE